ncbi:MAG: bifunctional indole-3-glycerol phosphate synthase/phosphoribosylanthranilate isomerase [Treponema sp.]|nr:bifunctional indole-3-glycerol phosphate synthase/phosphoribosylanthranilate isomerase [Treponema sp.]
MALDILTKIVEGRKADIKKRGLDFGYEIPQERKRRVHPFIQEKGVVLEVKRASPSKGDIAPKLNASETALAYQEAGASAISVLTEENYFKGNLGDLISVCQSVDIAVLRKDFLFYPDEIDIAYKCGADAVLLIARILEKDVLARMLERVSSFGMTAFVELRLADDLQKLVEARAIAGANVPAIVCGVNARDLKDFSIDLLTPLGFLEEIKAAMGQDCNVVFESGIRTAQAASFAGSLGFAGLLLGEAAARDTSKAASFVKAFVSGTETPNALAWKKITVRKISCKTKNGAAVPGLPKIKPLVKICGLTNNEDAMAAAELGADLLGFVFCEASPRNASEAVVREVRVALQDLSQAKKGAAFLVGVITDTTSQQAKTALALARQGVLDFIQLHGQTAANDFFADKENLSIPHYCAANLFGADGLDKIQGLLNLGEPRVLIDAKVGDKVGGTGTQVAEDLVFEAKKKSPLWLAGGLSADNVREIIEKYSPELIDACSLLEAAPGKKDLEKLKAFFAEIGAAVAGGASQS